LLDLKPTPVVKQSGQQQRVTEALKGSQVYVDKDRQAIEAVLADDFPLV